MHFPLKPGLTLHWRLEHLPVAENGYPVPWFVDWINGKPEFRAMDPKKFQLALSDNRCWVCGGRMGKFKTFVVGPMCTISRTSAEPPSHHECAVWSAQNCPFLSNPNMVRNEKGMEGAKEPAGMMIKRNPGVTALWTTTKYEVFKAGSGYLLHFDWPLKVEWFARGKRATKAEVRASIESGYPALFEVAKAEGAVDQLETARALAERYLPGDEDP